VTLHYTADPAKRSKEWKEEAAYGMIPEKFRREYEIDYTAVMGAKVFPEFGQRKKDIVVEEPLPDFGKDVRYWGGFDYGSRNPSSFHVYTIVDNIIYSVWELFRPCDNIPKFVEEMKTFPYWSKIRYIACDPDMIRGKQAQASGEQLSLMELFQRAGVHNMVAGNNNEDTWVASVRKHWFGTDEPTFKLFSSCHNQIREFEMAVYTNQSERQLLTQTYKEQIRNKDNHALDDCKYFMNSRPTQQAQFSTTYGNIVRSYSQKGGPSSRPSAGKRLIKGYV
jgi:hypothetical protein